jgi:hypothetical protein
LFKARGLGLRLITPVWSTLTFLRLKERKRDRDSQLKQEEAKLKRLVAQKAPHASINWVRRQIAYIRDGGFLAPVTYYFASVRKPKASYVEHNCHEMAVEYGRVHLINLQVAPPSARAVYQTRTRVYMVISESAKEPYRWLLCLQTKETIIPWTSKIFDPGKS